MQKYVSLIAFLWQLISKEHVVVIMEFPDWVQVIKYTIARRTCVKKNVPRVFVLTHIALTIEHVLTNFVPEHVHTIAKMFRRLGLIFRIIKTLSERLHNIGTIQKIQIIFRLGLYDPICLTGSFVLLCEFLNEKL